MTVWLIYSDNLPTLFTLEDRGSHFVTSKMAAAVVKRNQMRALHFG